MSGRATRTSERESEKERVCEWERDRENEKEREWVRKIEGESGGKSWAHSRSIKTSFLIFCASEWNQ